MLCLALCASSASFLRRVFIHSLPALPGHPAALPQFVQQLLENCWNKVATRRPKFAQIAAECAKNGEPA